MSLSLYNKKRNFSQTPEPAGKETKKANALVFVVQKHDASSLHYDFRLQMEGVLKSWAVPKGPSLNPADKRLAMLVEDHPFDYRKFEGSIPEGNYGAGTVIVWDEGTYELLDGESLSVKEQEKKLLEDLKRGSLKIKLSGKKLKGAFALFGVKRDTTGKQWLLVKKGDEWATDEDVTVQDASVLSGKTIAQMAAQHGVEPNHPETSSKKSATKKSAATKATTPTKAAVKKGKESTKKTSFKSGQNKYGPLASPADMPGNIKPMLATLVDKPFNSKDWLFEIKWDGYRALAYADGENVELVSRNKKLFTDKYESVREALQSLGIQAVLDGEIVAVDEKGLANFQLLQNWQNNGAALQFFVFDVLWLNGYDVTRLPLLERKRLLKDLLPADHNIIKYSDHVLEKGTDFFDVALEQGLEGIMAKRGDSIYVPDKRTEDWVKVKVVRRQEVIICGFTQPRNTRKYFGALLLGVYKDGELIYVGHTGSGFNTKSLGAIYNELQALVIKDCPFAKCPKGNMPVTWVAPQLVCEIKFTEWTKESIARHPIFMGLRSDKKAKEVIIEKETAMAKVVKGSSSKAAAKKSAAPKKSAAKKEAPKKSTAAKGSKGKQSISTSHLQVDWQAEKDQTVTISGQELKLTNGDKLYWKKEGITKGDMINYYLRVAPYMLPYLLDRPHSLNRHPNGVGSANFYQKNVEGKVPDWVQKHEDFSESTNVAVQYMVCANEASLIYMANLGCIEINPWHARTSSVLQPDWCLIDLDPDKKNTYDQVVETALVIKRLLDSIGAESYPKTSGSTGMHIYIPLGANYSFEESKSLAEGVVNLAQKELPKLTSVERNPDKRKGKIYLDFLQNKETQTAAAPYSLRPKPGAPVSAPLHWSEVKKGLTAHTYTIHNIFDRLQAEGDLFSPVLGKGINLQKVLQQLQTLTG
jgi:bifunctional non-homologous end joining protein LigD